MKLFLVVVAALCLLQASHADFNVDFGNALDFNIFAGTDGMMLSSTSIGGSLLSSSTTQLSGSQIGTVLTPAEFDNTWAILSEENLQFTGFTSSCNGGIQAPITSPSMINIPATGIAPGAVVDLAADPSRFNNNAGCTPGIPSTSANACVSTPLTRDALENTSEEFTAIDVHPDSSTELTLSGIEYTLHLESNADGDLHVFHLSNISEVGLASHIMIEGNIDPTDTVIVNFDMDLAPFSNCDISRTQVEFEEIATTTLFNFAGHFSKRSRQERAVFGPSVTMSNCSFSVQILSPMGQVTASNAQFYGSTMGQHVTFTSDVNTSNNEQQESNDNRGVQPKLYNGFGPSDCTAMQVNMCYDLNRGIDQSTCACVP